MALWLKNSGTKLTTLQERNTIVVPLPLNNDEISDSTNFSVSVISGNLPNGLRIKELDQSLYTVKYGIAGTPLEVARNTEYKFVLRATHGSTIEDRTYIIEVQGPDEPQWVTSADLLPLGNNNTYYILDSAPVDFQLVAIDNDTSAGQTLEYYIGSGDGELPPGIELTDDGRLVGVVDPILALEKSAGSGYYDQELYASAPYDFGIRSANGYDSFFYDVTTYDFNFTTKSPRKLNRYYQFTVSVSDGDTIARRTFRIYVVGDDFLRADNTIMQVGTGTFTADNTHIRTPIWVTPRDFGYRRANNYVTLVLDTIDPNTLSGVIVYTLETENDDGSQSILPPGLSLDSTTGEIAGIVPYQPAVTREYKFTVKAKRYGPSVNSSYLTFTTYEETDSGNSTVKIKKFSGDINQLVGTIFQTGNYTYKIASVNDNITAYDTITLGETVNFTVAETAIAGADTLKVTGLGDLYDSLINETISVGGDNYDVLNVNDGSKVYRAKSSHTSTGTFNSDLWEEVEDSSSVSLYWTANTFYERDMTIRYTEQEFVTLTIASTDGSSSLLKNISSGLQITHTILTPTQSLWKQNTSITVTSVTNTLDFETSEKNKTFSVRMLGEVDSTISWLTDSDLGDISANYISTLFVRAQTTVPNARLLYSLVEGSLPSGLSLSPDGELIGKIRPFGTVDNPGLTVFDNQNFSLDGNTTTIDRDFSFTIKAQDQFGFSAIERSFTVTVSDPDNKSYSNLFFKPFLKQTSRQAYTNFISNPDIFNPDYIYRPNDPNFGLQKQIKILAYAGIESKNAEEYVAAAAKNHKRKRFKLGQVKTAVARLPGTDDIVYEIVYVEVIDPQDDAAGTAKTFKIRNDKKITVNSVSYDTDNDSTGLQSSEPMRFRPTPENTIKADSDAITVSNPNDNTRYISNITNMRDNLREIGETELNFLPLWMQTTQQNSVNNLGFVLAIPLCYCKAGTGQIVKDAVEFSEFNFKQFDIDVDRYVIDSTEGNSNEQYILFANYKFNV